MSGVFFPPAGVVPDSTLLFCDGPVWIGVQIDGVAGAEILDSLASLTRYVKIAAAHAPRGSSKGPRFRKVCGCGGQVLLHGAGANWGDLKCARCGSAYCQDCGEALDGYDRCPNVPGSEATA